MISVSPKWCHCGEQCERGEGAQPGLQGGRSRRGFHKQFLSNRSHFVVPDGIQKLVFHLLLFFLMCCYILGHHRLPWEDKALRRNLWANLRGGRGPLLVHQAVQRRGEVRDPQARGIPPVEDCLLDHERAHHTKNDLSHQAWGVRTQQARKVSIGSTPIRGIDQ